MKSAHGVINPVPFILLTVAPLAALGYLSIAPSPVHSFNVLYKSANLDTVLPLECIWALFHMGTYAGLTVLLSMNTWIRRNVRHIGLSVYFLGLGLEIIQELSGERSFEAIDLLANTAGIVLGLMVYKLYRGRLAA